MRHFRIELTLSVDLSTDDLWPDGDAPEKPTPDDVCNLVYRCGGPVDIIKDWNLDDDLELSVAEVCAECSSSLPRHVFECSQHNDTTLDEVGNE